MSITSAPPGWIERALAVAVKHHQAGLLDEARQLYIRILEHEPRHSDALYLLATLALQCNDMELSAGLIAEALAVNPSQPIYHVLQGNLRQRRGALEESAACYLRALTLDPNCADALYNLGNTRQQQGRLREAMRCFEEAIKANPLHVEAHNNLGNLYRDDGRTQEAVECYQRAIHLDPACTMAHSNLGIAYRQIGMTPEAAASFERAVALRPDVPQLHVNLGNVRIDQDRLGEAISCFENAIRLDPRLAEAHVNLGNVLLAQGRIKDAFGSYRRGLSIKPEFAEGHSAFLFALHYDPALKPETIAAEHREWGKRHAAHLAPARNSFRRHSSRIRVGYVSPDFRRHSVSYFALPVIEAHDPAHFEIFCYSDVKSPDEMTARFQKHSHWRNTTAWNDEQLAAQIRKDEIDILIDLAGHTSGNRLLVFARKPAPIQMTWLGYPNTTGLEAIDYRITDSWADPEGLTESLHTEHLLRLPAGFLCYQPDPAAPLPEFKDKPFTFGCFNNFAKINPPLLSLWSRILQRVPGSMLMLKNKALGDPHTRELFTSRLLEAGIDPQRVRLEGFRSKHFHHLAAYHEVDIALDTFPYHGTTTTCEALWMGVPVLTLEGRTHVSRVGVSLLKRCRLDQEWIAATPDEYVDRAVKMAADRAYLRSLRFGLREHIQAAGLTDARTFTRHLECAYRQAIDSAFHKEALVDN